MRLIDADDLIVMEYGGIKFIPKEFIDDAPKVDAVEVVRCKDCEWCKTNYSWNGKEYRTCAIEPYEPIRGADDFCSKGERKDDQ